MVNAITVNNFASLFNSRRRSCIRLNNGGIDTLLHPFEILFHDILNKGFRNKGFSENYETIDKKRSETACGETLCKDN